MTVKRRLLVSNALMIIILLAAIMANMLMDRMGIYAPSRKDMNLFYQTVSLIREYADEWEAAGSPELMIKDIDRSEIFAKGSAVSLAIYEDGNHIYAKGNFIENALFEMAEIQPEQKHFTMDNVALYATSVGDYRLYLMNTAHEYGEEDKVEGVNTPFPYGIIAIVIIVMIASRLLNHMVFKGIVIPLGILVDGVHEIRDGNLNYRIQYHGKDEFVTICEDFNEMARQIQNLMEARKKDDENRRELIAGISHDLRTPLTSIKAYVEGIQKGVAATPLMHKEYLETIADKTNDLEHIVTQLFLFSKLDIGDFPFTPELLDMGNELARYHNSVAAEYEKRRLNVVLQDFEKNIMVRVDPVQLRNVFTNLLENTLKYGNQENNIIKIGCVADRTNVIVTFQDNGPGVAEDRLEKLFNAFFRTDKARKNPGQGSGLGLAISRKIVERLNGSIRAENAAEGGLKIVIVLPTISGGHDEENSDY